LNFLSDVKYGLLACGCAFVQQHVVKKDLSSLNYVCASTASWSYVCGSVSGFPLLLTGVFHFSFVTLLITVVYGKPGNLVDVYKALRVLIFFFFLYAARDHTQGPFTWEAVPSPEIKPMALHMLGKPQLLSSLSSQLVGFLTGIVLNL
jgi:hypothetical protein